MMANSGSRLDGVLRQSMWVGCSALASMALSMSAHAQGGQAAGEEEGKLSEIVVTAQKREQNLQDVPISVTAIAQGALLTNRITTVTDIAMLAPNLTIRDVAGSNGVPAVSLRGITVFGTFPGQDRSVPMYLDGVWIGASSGLAFDLPDLDRIEVLRGPQGTLFGKNATAGAISIYTRDPAGQAKVRSTLTVGNYAQLKSSTRIDTPEFGPFSASVSYTHDERRGDVKNLGAGTMWDRTAAVNSGQGIARSPKYLGGRDADAVFVSVKFEPSDSFKTVYKFDWTKNWYTPEGTAVVLWNPARLGAFLGGAFNDMYAANPFPISSGTRPKAVNNGFSTPSRLKALGHNVTSTLKISDSVSLRNILAYRKSSNFANTDYGISGFINTNPFLGDVDAPYIVFASQTASRTKQWSDELQLNYDSEPLTLTVGGLFVKVKGQFGSAPGLASPLFFVTVPNYKFALTTGEITYATNKSLAGYAQAEVHVTPQLDLVGGYRVTQDKKNIESNLPGPTKFLSSYNKTRGSYHLGVNFKPRQGMLLYAKYGTAFVAGGEINTIEFKPETVKSWEVGFKGDFFDRRLRTNIALFDATYKNNQQLITGNSSDTDDIPSSIPIALISLGTIKAKGVEAEVTALPFNGVTLGGGLGYTDYSLSNLDPRVGVLASYRLTQRSKWTANLSAQYESQPLIGDARLLVRVDAAYRSKYRTSSTIPVAADYKPFEFIGSEWVVNARAGLGGIDVGPTKVDVTAWVRNLTDTGKPQFPVVLFGAAAPFVTTTSFTKARTFGLDLSVSY